MARDRTFVPCAVDLESRKLTASANLGSSFDALAISLSQMASQTPVVLRQTAGQAQSQAPSSTPVLIPTIFQPQPQPSTDAGTGAGPTQPHQEAMLARTYGAGSIQQANIRPVSGQLINQIYPVIGLSQPISIHHEFNDLVFLVVL